LDVFGQTRHQVLAVLVQRLALLLVLVRRVHDGGLELRHGIARGILRTESDTASAGSRYSAHPHVRRFLALAGDLLRPQRSRSKGAHSGARTARRARDGAQWPGHGEPHSHCVCGEGGGLRGAAGEGDPW
jgi:hypothetical protein